jgi:hypothetical protein
MKKGDKVRMSKETKEILSINGSLEHVMEFGDCVGIVEDRCFPTLPEEVAPEYNVRWMPSNLRYGYSPKELILEDGSSPNSIEEETEDKESKSDFKNFIKGIFDKK